MILFALALAASQAEAADPLQGLLECRAVESQTERLECFDALADAVAPRIESNDLVTVSREEARESQRQGFGLPTPSLPNVAALIPDFSGEPGVTEDLPEGGQAVLRADGSIDQLLDVPVTAARETASGQIELTLANGQVWRQSDRRHVRPIRDRHIERGLTATVSAGALGSHMMTLSIEPRAFRVERVR
jgi:hypothetical protein